MSGRIDRRIRKGLNAFKAERTAIADELVREFMNSPFKFRFRFALALIFHRRKKQ